MKRKNWVLTVLKSSFHLLLHEPKILLPRLITTTLYSLYYIFLAKFTYDYSKIIFRGEENLASLLVAKETFFSQIPLILTLLLILLIIDLLTYAMYPQIVYDYQKKRKISLIKALKMAISSWKALFVLGTILIIVSIALSITLLFFSVLAIILKVWEILIFSALLSLLFTLILMVFLYFLIPVSVIQKKNNLIESFAESFKLSFKHKKDVFIINFSFLILFLLTFILMTITEFSEEVALIAIAAFVIARLIQSVIYTYFFVTSPYFYLTTTKS